MPITKIDKDPEALTMTVVADFPVTAKKLWNAYADPRQIEQFWGPPSWPATFYRHDMVPGGRSHFVMNGPEGGISAGYWEFLSVNAPHSFEVLDGFAFPDGTPNTEMPSMRMTFQFEETPQGSRLITTTFFASLEQLEELPDMGMQEGMEAAMGQIDDVLADLTAFAQEGLTQAQILDDTRIRVARFIRGTVDQVWEAHHNQSLLQQWLLGPDGWTMPVCEVAQHEGERFRYEWENQETGERFGFTGELREIQATYREVTTETLIGEESPETLNEMTLTPFNGATLLSIVITYPSLEVRDAVLATGMVDGMEASYSRMESLIG